MISVLVMEYHRHCIRKCIFCLIIQVLFLFLFAAYHKLHSSSKEFLVKTNPTSKVELTLPGLERECDPVGYMMACAVPEQLESGMYDLYQLADLAESWGMILGEPTIQGSVFQFPLSEKYHWKLRNVFDMGDLNNNLRKDFKINYDLVVSSEEILADKKLGSDIVFIHWTDLKDLSSEKCFKLASSRVTECFHATPFKDWTQNITRNTICLRRSDKINFKSLLHKHPILKRVALENIKIGSKFTVIFSNWNGIRPKPDIFFFWDPNFHQRNYGYVHAIMHSKEVRKAAKELKGALNLKTTFIGIHIRLEKLIRNKLSLSDLKKCIDMLEFNIKRLKQSHLNSSAIVFTDYKPLGSRTCYAQCVHTSKQLGIDKRLKSLGVEVNPKLKNSITSSLRSVSGFVSNVEQELLSQADFLILTGFGGFQVGITKRFARYHNITELSAEARFIRICQDH